LIFSATDFSRKKRIIPSGVKRFETLFNGIPGIEDTHTPRPERKRAKRKKIPEFFGGPLFCMWWMKRSVRLARLRKDRRRGETSPGPVPVLFVARISTICVCPIIPNYSITSQ
jgi:hypothetical protein